MSIKSMAAQFRPYQSEDEYRRMREFLREMFLRSGRRAFSWHVAWLDYARWNMCLNCAKVWLEDAAHLWEDSGRTAAFLMPDGGRGEVHFCVRPELRVPARPRRAADRQHPCQAAPGAGRRGEEGDEDFQGNSIIIREFNLQDLQN
jgi:hypothetical protein